jgi:ADP-ribose pyrophosphatase YjhB (NUDIX family)
MPKPVTPLVGCDVFILNGSEQVLLIKRVDSDLWALPGGFHDLGETPARCAIRECFEETGHKIEILRLLGVFSSNCYEFKYIPWKNEEYCHILFQGNLIGGKTTVSEETREIGWFSHDDLPLLYDGHETRIKIGFEANINDNFTPYFE